MKKFLYRYQFERQISNLMVKNKDIPEKAGLNGILKI